MARLGRDLERPKGMHHKTYMRLLLELRDAEHIYSAGLSERRIAAVEAMKREAEFLENV